MAIAYGGHDVDGEEESVGKGPSLGPGVPLSIIVKSVGGINHLLYESIIVFLNLELTKKQKRQSYSYYFPISYTFC